MGGGTALPSGVRFQGAETMTKPGFRERMRNPIARRRWSLKKALDAKKMAQQNLQRLRAQGAPQRQILKAQRKLAKAEEKILRKKNKLMHSF